jgi:hypothetical protein
MTAGDRHGTAGGVGQRGENCSVSQARDAHKFLGPLPLTFHYVRGPDRRNQPPCPGQ